MKEFTAASVLCMFVLAVGFVSQGCNPGPLPVDGLRHAVAAMDRGLVASAFVAEIAWDENDVMFGLFEANEVEFLHGYAASCQAGEAIGWELDEWADPSVQVVECDVQGGFRLNAYDEDDMSRLITELLVIPGSTPEGNKTIRTHATIVGLEEDDGPPLASGTVFNLVTEITPERNLVKRTMEEGTRVILDVGDGGQFLVEYNEGEAAFHDPECPQEEDTRITFTATVSGGTSGLEEAEVTIHGKESMCIPLDHDGGPVPGLFDVMMEGETTRIEYLLDDEKDFMELRAANTIDGEYTETFCRLGEKEGEKDVGILEADFLLDSEWVVQTGRGEMELSVYFPPGSFPHSSLVFRTYPTSTASASKQTEPSLLGLLIHMDDHDDWCDRDDDGDGVLNCDDFCPHDEDPCDDPWCYGDDDEDGMPNCNDSCPENPDPNCDWCDLDDDEDGIDNCKDYCPHDFDPCDNTWCYGDDDEDGRPNCNDSCPNNPDPECEWCDGDQDQDGIPNCEDPCPEDPNPECQDWCDMDNDGDGIPNCEDPCPEDPNPECKDWCDMDNDGDGIPNCEDPCPEDPNLECQDWCDMDNDGDGRMNCEDPCPEDPNPDCLDWCSGDEDMDNVLNCGDNCPYTANPDQANADWDKWGDACDPCPQDHQNLCV